MPNREEKLDNGPGQAELFSAATRHPASLDVDLTLRMTVTQILRDCKKSRETIAEEMTFLTGVKVTDHMLYCYSAESKEAHRFPAAFIPAFCRATGDYRLLSALVAKLGARVIDEGEALLLEIAKKQLIREEIDQEMESLKREVRATRRTTR